MKFKYYLRGLSIGILVTVIIIAVSSALHKDELSDDEIIARAKELGMVMAEDVEAKIPADDSKEPDSMPSADGGSQGIQEENTQDVPGNTQITQIEFTVEVGESSNQVAQKLAEQGLVDNAETFNQYMVDNGYDERVQAGNVTIPQGADYETIARLLIEKAAE